MSHYFLQDTPLAGLERQMMLAPNFTPRRSAMRFPGGYTPTAADVDCRYCLQYHRKSCRSLTCPYLAERLEAGAVTLEELAEETVRPWKHPALKERAMRVVRQAGAFRFEEPLHAVRMMDVVDKSRDFAGSKWLAAVYLLCAHTEVWVQVSKAVWRNQIDFAFVKLNGIGIQDYVLYRAAKGIFHGTLGATSGGLADGTLVSGGTLLLVLNAAMIARYGPQVMKIGRGENGD